MHSLGRGDGPSVVVQVHDRRAWRALLGGSLPLADAYAAGWWDADDLVGVFRLGAANMRPLDTVRRWATPLREPFQRLRAAGASAGFEASREDIHAHYDLGNDFFSEMLDEDHDVQRGYFATEDVSLHDASLAKLELVCTKLGLGPEDHVLEIGTGWGGFAVHAVGDDRLPRDDDDDLRGAVRVCDGARACGGPGGSGHRPRSGLPAADRQVLRARFSGDDRGRRLARLRSLHAHLCGAADGRRPDAAAGDHDDRPCVPGGEGVAELHPHAHLPERLPAVAVGPRKHAGRHELQIVDHQDLTWHYARTLEAWRENLTMRAARLEELGYDDEFRRMWRLYLAYCEAGFAERRIQVGQTMYAKSRWRGAAPVPREAGLDGVDALGLAAARAPWSRRRQDDGA